MRQNFKGWGVVAENLYELAGESGSSEWKLNCGQRASLNAIAKRLSTNGVLIADEVGMGKTRIAVAVARSVVEAGGRVAILVPPGLGPQWRREELRPAGIECPPILNSLWSFLQAWESVEDKNQKPWFSENVVLISHLFTNWRLGERSDSWRWALLPELYAQWRKMRKHPYPRGYHNSDKLDDNLVRRAARSVCSAIPEDVAHPSYKRICDLAEQTPWHNALDAAEYGRDDKLRPLLEHAVGLGLGVFDLVIIDEAHKSRGEDSGLSRLLDGVVLAGESNRRLAITATPVELHINQWEQTLNRLKVESELLKNAIGDYAEAVKAVQQTPSNQQIRGAFRRASRDFQEKLSPYLLRRDKRQDPYVQKFAAHRPLHEYRQELEIIIETSLLSHEWKQSVCAAESLSLVARQAEVDKRLRLTLGNGHGIASLLDQVKCDDESDKLQEDHDGTYLPEGGVDTDVTDVVADKRQLRAQWWRDIMCRPFEANDQSEAALYEHPAILAAVEAIEDTCRVGEKVLVFGRFTLPLQALVNLLNAREMLRCLDAKRHWPQEKVHADEWPAIQAAHLQLKRSAGIDREQIEQVLFRQYKLLENKREQYRRNLISNIEKGISIFDSKSRLVTLLEAFKDSVKDLNKSVYDVPLLALMAKAMQEYTGLEIERLQPEDYYSAFADLIDALSDRDEGDTNGDGELDKEEAAYLWDTLAQRLAEEYSRQQGGFARLMNGGTSPVTRRMLQAAFNRLNCYPMVLVAQSLVGREGLNLHKACRTVVLLHPEWNPGVVEQQIGRVDRVGSLWEGLLDRALEKLNENSLMASDLPRIQVRPVIFKGTYDEKNWEVLRRRWNDLRAQLHGIIIPPSIAEKYENADFVKGINEYAPNFSPLADM